MTQTHLLTLHTLSPLHCGTGQAVGAIELPIAREKPTNLPIVPGSSIKGVLRAQEEVKGIHLAAFGPDTANAGDQAGAVQFGDARLVLLPMRSVAGVFAWTASPYLLRRFKKDLEAADKPSWKDEVSVPEKQQCHATTSTALATSLKRVVLEDLDFTISGASVMTDGIAKALGEAFFPGDTDSQAFLKSHLCIVHDDVMGLLLDTGTELQAHVRLDPETKTVADGALWHEESLPVESLLASLVLVNPEMKKGGVGTSADEIGGHLKKLCHQKAIQFGGKASVGKGLCHVGLA
jgi:CRISPR-associated protein Cmr4